MSTAGLLSLHPLAIAGRYVPSGYFCVEVFQWLSPGFILRKAQRKKDALGKWRLGFGFHKK